MFVLICKRFVLIESKFVLFSISGARLVAGTTIGYGFGTRISRLNRSYSMSIKRLHPGPRMSQAVIHGGVAYLAGQVANNTKGQSVTEQTKDVLAAIDGLLKQAGTDKSKLLTAQIWLTDMGTFGQMNAVWDGWVSAGNTPARATVQSPALAAPGYDVEIMVTAAI
jgi:enamine deaminase RidA (YjgF/YER057c/UK114 family)